MKQVNIIHIYGYFSYICPRTKTYLHGSKHYCENQLNALMFPTIFLSSLTSVLASVLDKDTYGATILSGISASIAFLLAIVSYLKLDAQSEALIKLLLINTINFNPCVNSHLDTFYYLPIDKTTKNTWKK